MNLLKGKNYNKLTSWSSVEMKADKTAELNISGYIGIPEWWQFDPDMEKEVISTKEKMQAELKAISNLKVDTIKVNIDSLGGDVNHGQAMYSALAKNPANIEVEYTGWSASIATIIGAAGKDNVSMSNTNMILIHKARGCQCGTSSDMTSYASMLNKVDDTMANVYADQTGNSSSEMLEQMSVNNGDGEWLTANEAQEIGLINNIIEPMKAAANYDLTRLSKFGYKIPQNKLKTINMNLFGKDKPINALAMQDDSILLHEGELKEGSELKTTGENKNIEAGVFEAKDGRKITVDENSKVTSIEDAPTVTATAEGSEILTQVAELVAEEIAKITAVIEELRKTGSKAQVQKINLTGHKPEKIGTQGTVKAALRVHYDEIQKKKQANQEK